MASQSYPPGGTWFDTLKKTFADVPIDKTHDNTIPTTEFLEAAESLTTLFDLLGSVAFTPVKNDMLGNIKKIRDRQLAAPLESQNLQSLVRNELKAKKHTSTEGLLWLVRYSFDPFPFPNPRQLIPKQNDSGLDFTATALRHNVSNPSSELSDSFRAAYTTTLKPHHSFLVKPIFSAAMSATPYRKDFYAKLASDQQKTTEALEKWLGALEEEVGVMREFMGRGEAKW
ncbi:MAG: hypothetical protein LQ351_001559 [Letrouitia transgressa]|nr:MAG: hypothetical protein LQ351_001559 [Letrouitia transgressa]